MEDVSAFQFYHGDSKKKTKKSKKKGSTAEERESIAKELALMKSYLAKNASKGGSGEAYTKKSNKGQPQHTSGAGDKEKDQVKDNASGGKKRKRQSSKTEVADSPAQKKAKNAQAVKQAPPPTPTNNPTASKKTKKQNVNGSSPTAGNGNTLKASPKVNAAKDGNQVSKETKSKKADGKMAKNVKPGNGPNQSQKAEVVQNKIAANAKKTDAKARNASNGTQSKVESTLSAKKKQKRGVAADDDEEEEIPTLVPITTNGDLDSDDDDDDEAGSVEVGQACFDWMVHPVSSKTFFSDTFEKRPIHIKRGKPDYYKNVMSTSDFDEILRTKDVFFGKNLDVTSYSDGKRETHNPEGQAYPPVVWDYYNKGCSLRLLNPQTFHEQVWRICATLQEFLGSMVGANMYLTPPGTQGFAPHYDDVEVFILQLEGKKRWRLYEPRSSLETLPRFSSPNFSQDEIGQPCKDFILEAGDMIYMPRGTIHQGTCLEDEHSLHITISCHQLNTFGDLLEKLLPDALQTAMEEDISFREGLPHDYMNFMGMANSEKSTRKRSAFIDKVKGLVDKLFTYASVDIAADQLGRRFMHDALPPYLSDSEKARSVVSGGEGWDPVQKKVVNRVEMVPETEVRLIRAHCLRIVAEEDNKVRLYNCVENSREFHEREEQFIEIEADQAAVVDVLVNAYPAYISLASLQSTDLDIIQMLWENKLLMTRQPLDQVFDDDDDDDEEDDDEEFDDDDDVEDDD